MFQLRPDCLYDWDWVETDEGGTLQKTHLRFRTVINEIGDTLGFEIYKLDGELVFSMYHWSWTEEDVENELYEAIRKNEFLTTV